MKIKKRTLSVDYKNNIEDDCKQVMGTDLVKGTKGACGLHCIKIKNFKVKIGSNVIVENINLHIHCGKLTVIIGKNGTGKTTLIKAINGELKHEGVIEFRDKKNDKYQIKMIDYSELYPDDPEGHLDLDIISGKMPDLIELGWLDDYTKKKYIEKGAFLDLTQAFSKGGALEDLELLPNIA